MSSRGEQAVWARARAVASTLAPAASWQETLASTFLELEGVTLSWVCTCPPGYPFLARGAALPEPEGLRLTRQFLHRGLGEIERDDFALRMLRRFGAGAFLAMEQIGGDAAFQEKMRRTLFAPFGVEDAVHAFLAVGPEQLLGWLSLGVRKLRRGGIERLVEELGEVSRLASKALGDALVVAQGCGAVLPTSERVVLRALSAREAEIAEMVGRGWSDLNIAHRLHISEHTVATHLRRVFGKLGLHSRVELAACAGWLASPGRAGGLR